MALQSVQPFSQGSQSLQTLGTDRQADQPTDHATFVCSNRPHPASAAMWPNNTHVQQKVYCTMNMHTYVLHSICYGLVSVSVTHKPVFYRTK